MQYYAHRDQSQPSTPAKPTQPFDPSRLAKNKDGLYLNLEDSVDIPYNFIADSPVGALVCSIFLGPLGLQGWLIDPSNPNYYGLGKSQRTLTYVIYGLLVATILFWVFAGETAPKDSKEEAGAGTYALAIAGTLTYSALAISLFISFIFACILVARKKK